MLYFEDTDGDGRADRKRIVMSGFGTEDTHHIVHTLRWGPDGRLYFNQSIYIHTHMETPWGVVRLNSGGIWAYDPRTERVEVFAKGWINSWGHAWDQWGQSFATDGAGSGGINWTFPGGQFVTYEGARRILPSISPGSYPKFCGLELIYSPHFPADWQGTAVTNDFRAHKVVQFRISDLGLGNASAPGANPQSAVRNPQSGYAAEQISTLVQTSDATFRPIDVKLGPDGALYIADWSNPIINHGEVDFRDPRRDHEHGRIWRLSVKGGKPVKWEGLVGKRNVELSAKLLSQNLWEKQQARAVLGADADVCDGYLQYWLKLRGPESDNIRQVDDSQMEHAKREVLWLLQKNDLSLSSEPRVALSGEPGLRAVAARFAGYLAASRFRDSVMRPECFGLNTSIEVTVASLKQLEAALAQTPEADRKRAVALKKEIQKNKSALDELYAVAKGRELAISEASDQLHVWASKHQDEVIKELAPAARDAHPRVRIEVMRSLARIPTRESAALILDAAVNAPKDDVFYDFAAWLSVNDLAPQVAEWVEKNSTAAAADQSAVRNPQSAIASNDAKVAFALQSLPAERSGPLLSKILTQRGLPRDGSGPWIELIGAAGGPGELRLLLDALLAATTPDGDHMKPLADAKHRFTAPDANRRAAAALVAAARRGARPAGAVAGELAPWQFFMYAPDNALPDVLRLAGLWKQDVPTTIVSAIDGAKSVPLHDAAFEALRTLATPKTAEVLINYLNGTGDRDISAANRRRALAALAGFRPNEAMKHLLSVVQETPERDQIQLWRGLFASAPFMQRFTQALPDGLPPASYVTALRAARELGRKGQPLAAKLGPLVGEKAAAPSTGPANYADLAARAKKDGDPVAGEALYRRTASACVTCHAIGGAGGKLGPDMTSIGASAPLDYIIESVLDPAAKVKEGFHAFAFKLKDGSEAMGIPSRETATEQFIRTIAGEQPLQKADIVSKKLADGGASLMPAGLTNAWTDRERLNLYAFLGELGRPGPFDASKNNVARVWQLSDTGKVDGTLKIDMKTAISPVYTLVDGRLTKDLIAQSAAILMPKNDTVQIYARFRAAGGRTKFNLAGVTKAWLDGRPLAVASEPSPTIELTAGEHVFTVEVNAKTPPEVVRVESPGVNFLGD